MRTLAVPGGSDGRKPRRAARVLQAALLVAAALAGCTQFQPYVPPSEGHIDSRQAKAEPQQAIPAARARERRSCRRPRPAPAPQTYSVVVNEVPVKELLLALARDTKQNIDIHPTLTGLVSLNAINETLPAILERVSKQVNMRYRTEGNTIVVSPGYAVREDLPRRLRQHRARHDLDHRRVGRDRCERVRGNGRRRRGGGSAAGAAAGTSGSSTVVRTTSRNDFWETCATISAASSTPRGCKA